MNEKLDALKVAARHGMMSADEVYAYKKAIELLPADPVVVNLGAGEGTSSMCVLEARPEAYIFSVDLHLRRREQLHIQEAGLPPNRCFRILSESWKVGWHFPYKIDLLFVDAAHYKEAVEKDIAAWTPHVKEDGIIAFHDYNHPNVPELTVVVAEKMSDYPVISQARYLICFQKRKNV